MNSHRFADASLARAFCLAGKARITLVSRVTGARFTYQINKGKTDRDPHFVSLLSGPNNTQDFCFLGIIFEGRIYRRGQRSSISEDAPSARAFAWAWDHILGGSIPANCEVWHEGRCGRCGRPLTVPESIESGIGPVCEESATA